MPEYDKIDMSEKIDVNKTNGLDRCIICHYWQFLNISFRFQPEVCSGCHKLVQKAMIFNDVAIVTVKGNDYRIHFSYMSKYEARKLLRNADLTEKTKALYNLKIHYHI